MKLIHTDNFGGDYPDEQFVVGLPNMSEDRLRQVAKLINDLMNPEGHTHDRFYRVVLDDYVLRPGFEP